MDDNTTSAGMPGGVSTPPQGGPVNEPTGPVPAPEPGTQQPEVPPAPPSEPTAPVGGPPPAEPIQPEQSNPTPSGWGDQNSGGGAPVA